LISSRLGFSTLAIPFRSCCTLIVSHFSGNVQGKKGKKRP
jgi:hypothetical protein